MAGRPRGGAGVRDRAAAVADADRSGPTVLKARSVEREPTPEVLADIRAQLGLGDGPLHLPRAVARRRLVRSDAGRSWISGGEVLPDVLQALGASLLLMAVALSSPPSPPGSSAPARSRLGARRRLGGRRRGGTALRRRRIRCPSSSSPPCSPPSSGCSWDGCPRWGGTGHSGPCCPRSPSRLPAGAVLGRLLDDLLPGAFGEPWALAAAARGLTGRHIARRGVAAVRARAAAQSQVVRRGPHRWGRRRRAGLRHPRARPHHPPGRPRPGPARPPGRHPRPRPPRRARDRCHPRRRASASTGPALRGDALSSLHQPRTRPPADGCPCSTVSSCSPSSASAWRATRSP